MDVPDARDGSVAGRPKLELTPLRAERKLGMVHVEEQGRHRCGRGVKAITQCSKIASEQRRVAPEREWQRRPGHVEGGDEIGRGMPKTSIGMGARTRDMRRAMAECPGTCRSDCTKILNVRPTRAAHRAQGNIESGSNIGGGGARRGDGGPGHGSDGTTKNRLGSFRHPRRVKAARRRWLETQMIPPQC